MLAQNSEVGSFVEHRANGRTDRLKGARQRFGHFEALHNLCVIFIIRAIPIPKILSLGTEIAFSTQLPPWATLADRDGRTILGIPRSRPTVAGGMDRPVDNPVAGNPGQQRTIELTPMLLGARQHGWRTEQQSVCIIRHSTPKIGCLIFRHTLFFCIAV
jgi:hypothetical protein